MNDDLNKALMILVTIQHEYPAVYRSFELDKVAQHIIDSQGPIMMPYIQTMTDEEKARFVEANPMTPTASSNVVITTCGGCCTGSKKVFQK